MSRLIVLLAAVLAPAVSAQPCPVEGAPVSPCAEVTLVTLVDQAEALELTESQLAALEAIRTRDLRAVHEILGDIMSLQEMLHELDRPYDTAEVFALFYEIDLHEAELARTFSGAEAALLAVLSGVQRTRWMEMITSAVSIHDPERTRSVRGDAP